MANTFFVFITVFYMLEFVGTVWLSTFIRRSFVRVTYQKVTRSTGLIEKKYKVSKDYWSLRI